MNDTVYAGIAPALHPSLALAAIFDSKTLDQMQQAIQRSVNWVLSLPVSAIHGPGSKIKMMHISGEVLNLHAAVAKAGPASQSETQQRRARRAMHKEMEVVPYEVEVRAEDRPAVLPVVGPTETMFRKMSVPLESVVVGDGVARPASAAAAAVPSGTETVETNAEGFMCEMLDAQVKSATAAMADLTRRLFSIWTTIPTVQDAPVTLSESSSHFRRYVCFLRCVALVLLADVFDCAAFLIHC